MLSQKQNKISTHEAFTKVLTQALTHHYQKQTRKQSQSIRKTHRCTPKAFRKAHAETSIETSTKHPQKHSQKHSREHPQPMSKGTRRSSLPLLILESLSIPRIFAERSQKHVKGTRRASFSRRFGWVPSVSGCLFSFYFLTINNRS